MTIVVQCDVGDQPTDVATVNALARACLNARRSGDRIVVVNASTDLLELIELMGLRAVLVSR